METLSYSEKIARLAYWLVYGRHKPETCPKVGYLGYANGWSRPEWAVVCVIQDIMHDKAELNWRDYFNYDIDSSD